MFEMGWIKDEIDLRDYSVATKPRIELPNYVNHADLLPTVRNQGSMGACVGFALAGILTGTHIAQNAFQEWESPQYIWNWAREMRGMLDQNVGVYSRDAFTAVKDNGSLFEHLWPFSPDNLKISSSTKADVARFLADFVYTRCVDGVDGILTALADGNLVYVGTPWFNKWFYPDANGNLAEVDIGDPIAGGHAYIIFGYDMDIEKFFCQNSWGTNWGVDGRMKLPFSAIPVFKQMGGYDAYTADFNTTQEETVQVTFKGSVSKQFVAGEEVMVELFKDDISIDALFTQTNGDGQFETTGELTLGTYKAVASVEADEQYTAAESDPVEFTVDRQGRTITLEVTQ